MSVTTGPPARTACRLAVPSGIAPDPASCRELQSPAQWCSPTSHAGRHEHPWSPRTRALIFQARSVYSIARVAWAFGLPFRCSPVCIVGLRRVQSRSSASWSWSGSFPSSTQRLGLRSRDRCRVPSEASREPLPMRVTCRYNPFEPIPSKSWRPCSVSPAVAVRTRVSVIRERVLVAIFCALFREFFR